MCTRLLIVLIIFILTKDCTQTLLNQRCEPNSYVTIGCNVCRCDDKGKINKELCTKRTCDKVHIEQSRRTYNVNGSCEPGNWYSTEPCQLCYCVLKNKLVCNSNENRSRLILGNFHFTVCGNNLLQEASVLMTEGKDLRNAGKKKRSRNVARKISQVRTRPTIAMTTTTEGSYTEELYKDLLKNSKRKNKNSLNIGRNNNFDSNDDSGDDDYDSDKQIGLTMLPYDSDESGFNRKEKSDPGEGIDDKYSRKIVTGTKNTINSKEKSFAELDIPQIINKVLNFKMRKSMLSLDTKKQCTPGITYSSGCNKCFCLKNGKILCTKELCL